MPELIILIGIPASGKTSFHAAFFEATHLHVSKDRMIHSRRKDARQAAMIEDAFLHGKSAVVDNTHPNARAREPMIRLAKRLGARVRGYYFSPDIPGSLARNQARAGRARVPDAAIHIIARQWQTPTYAEGFDDLYRVRLKKGGRFEVERIKPPSARAGSDKPSSLG